MFNESDFLFLLGSLILVALSYYFMVIRKKDERRKKIIEEHFEGHQNIMGNRQQPNLIRNQQEEEIKEDKKIKSKADMLKDAKKREKEQKKEARKQEMERMRKMEEERLAKIEEKEEQENMEEKEEEKRLKKIEDEKKKKEEEEYDKWKNFLVLEETGNEIDNERDEENLLKNFIDYIKETMSRLKDLENAKMLSGVLDDRGKYIYIEAEEIKNIESLFNRKGKLSRSEMREEFSKLVRLEPKEEDLEKIKVYEKKYADQINTEFETIQNETEKNK